MMQNKKLECPLDNDAHLNVREKTLKETEDQMKIHISEIETTEFRNSDIHSHGPEITVRKYRCPICSDPNERNDKLGDIKWIGYAPDINRFLVKEDDKILLLRNVPH